jgi:tetratricopeptide (TPR) repeat protein
MAIGDHTFVCYARADQEFVLRIARALKERGFSVWLDQWNIPLGADWDQSIDDALRECGRLIIVLSPAATKSPEVRGELRTALNAGKPILPVLHRQCKIPRQLQLIQHVDLTHGPDDEEAFRRLETALGASGATQTARVGHVEQPPLRRAVGLEELMLQLAEAESRLDWNAVVGFGEEILKFDITDQAIRSRIAVGYRWQGLDWYGNKDYDAAIAAYNRAIDLDHDHARYYYLRAQAYGKKPKDRKGVNERGYIDNLRWAARLAQRGEELDRSALHEIHQAFSYVLTQSLLVTLAILFVPAFMGFLVVIPKEPKVAGWMFSLAMVGLSSGMLIGVVQRYTLRAWGYACGWSPTIILMGLGAVTGMVMGWLFPSVWVGELFILAGLLIFVTPLVVVFIACFSLVRRFATLPRLFSD